MLRIVASVVVLGGPSLLWAQTPAEALKKLEGEWQVEKFEFQGMAAPADAAAKMVFSIKGDQIKSNDKPDDPATITVDPSKSPAHITFTDKKKKVNAGIYKLDGDKVEMCFADEDQPRATEFKSTAENKWILIVLKKKK